MILEVLKVLVPTVTAFIIGMSLTPFLTDFLYKHKMWKKKVRNEGLDGGATPIFKKLHADRELHTPRMGGIIIWASAGITILLFWFVSLFFADDQVSKLNFLSRSQTWLPFFTLIVASLLGLVDDLVTVSGKKTRYLAGGLPLLKVRIPLVLVIGAIGGWWFFEKLDVSSIFFPFLGDINLGLLFIPFFMVVMLAVFSGVVIDGIDGLAGGIMAIMFASYSVIAFFQGQIDLAAFSAMVAGSTMAFLWFNIPPARFYMSETGVLGLTTTLTVIAFLTGQVVVLLLIALPLFLASGSVIIQSLSKKFRKKKVFLVAPIHHHFEALGWPPEKVTMRFWIISIVSAILGIIIAFIG